MIRTHRMIRYLTRWWQKENGDVSLVYIAGVMMLMLLFAGLAIDGGNAYLQRRRMQTAADAAALAGANAAAMEKSESEVASAVMNLLALNGADTSQSEWHWLDGNKGVSVISRQTLNTYFFRAFSSWAGATIDKPNYNSMDVGASGNAKYKPVSSKDELFPAAIEGCDCINLKQQVTIKKENTSRLCVNNTIRYWNPQHEYAIWLYKLDSTESGNSDAAVWHFKIVNGPGVFMEHSDGTATMSFQVKNYKGEGWNVNISLSGKTTVKGPGSPKFSAYTVDASEYMYYTNVTGTFTGIPGGRYSGAVLKITGHGPTFQMGVGANVMQAQKFGASSWYDWQVIRQPTIGNILRTPDIHGDVNVTLDYCDENVDNDEPTDASACEFNWVDWDSDVPTGGELTAAMSNLSKSGVWTIGDRVKLGPKSYSVQQVADKLNGVIDKPMTILVYDDTDGNPEDGYAVCGFASFTMNEYQLEQWPQLIRGEFTPRVVRALASSDDALDFGTRDVSIVR